MIFLWSLTEFNLPKTSVLDILFVKKVLIPQPKLFHHKISVLSTNPHLYISILFHLHTLLYLHTLLIHALGLRNVFAVHFSWQIKYKVYSLSAFRFFYSVIGGDRVRPISKIKYQLFLISFIYLYASINILLLKWQLNKTEVKTQEYN